MFSDNFDDIFSSVNIIPCVIRLLFYCWASETALICYQTNLHFLDCQN